MAKVTPIGERVHISRGNKSGDGGNDGGPPMEERIRRLENSVVRIDTMLPTLATKADLSEMRVQLHQEINSQTWKIVTFVTGFGSALVAATYFIARYIH